ncbi:LysR substrate-binding domain-containing protein [Variovorax sp. UMC13]|uniref:LysR substrate-binding domain-containing protein n=1 Tax=Variovorax sp. UMC13 TaxID=1862326 RepID=UPI0015FF5681|nr:LysR substrate-binding domain-containing protein [Variovorax sp. UMC13]MBB1601305.1 LysR family transcriptional regulator [Variovorax sp. UMC13]
MNINTIDLNLFLVFRAIYATRSVTAAGERLCMTQSAVSNALKRLRDRFNDPLFVRTAAGMQPTPMAQQLFHLIEEGLLKFTQAIDRARSFDPATSDRLMRIALNDVGHAVLLPTIMGAVRAAAPGVRMETVSPSTEQETRRLLQDGEIDLALGSWPSLGAGFRHETLFDESFTLLMRSAHPLRGRALTLEEYLDAEHVLYRPSGASELALQAALSNEGILARRKVVLTSAHFVGLAAVVASSDWMLTLPCRLAAAMKGREPGIAVAPLPFVLPPFPVLMQWHERVDSDGGNDWLRGLLTRHLGNLPMPAQIARRT